MVRWFDHYLKGVENGVERDPVVRYYTTGATDGRSIFLMDNVRRARFREAWDREVLMKPGEIYKIAFDAGNLSHVFNRGHRIRISVSSTGAPSYYPNPQTGEPFTAELPQKTATATMTVYHSGSRASRIIAPVVGEKIARR